MKVLFYERLYECHFHLTEVVYIHVQNVYMSIYTYIYILCIGTWKDVACILYSLIFNVRWWMVYLCKFSVNIFCWRILVTYSLWLIYWGRYVLFFNFIKMLVKCTMFFSSWIYVHVIIWFNKFLIQTSLQFLFIN